MACALNDAQLEEWLDQHSLPDFSSYFSGYGEFAAHIRQCDAEHLASLAELRAKLAAPDAPKLYFVPGIGLSDCPF